MEKRRILHSDVICLYIAIFCLLCKEIYIKNIYYYKISEVLFWFFIYVLYQVFFFCLLKPVGSMVGRRFPLLGISKGALRMIGAVLLCLYAVMILLFETHIFQFAFFLSPLRYVSNLAFGLYGFLFGLKKDKDEEWLYYLYGKEE